MKLISSVPFSSSRLLPPLIADYLDANPVVGHLHKYPFELSAFGSVIKDKAGDNTDRALLVEVLRSQYASIAATGEVRNNIESLLSEKTFTVTAAHQPCLFMGPLYNIYKICCAINLSRQLKKQFVQYHFVPVFWLGSEDHDTEELNHVYISGTKVEWKEAGKGAAGRWKTSSMHAAIDQLKSLGANEEVVELLENGLKKYDRFGPLTQYFVNEIFKEQGLVVLDQDDERLKKRFAEVMRDEILHSRAASVLQENIDWLDKNYKAQAKPRDINFFYLGEDYRERIVKNDKGEYEVMNTSLFFSEAEMVEEIKNHSGRFSPNVICRPLYQEMILPNLAFIGGAGELSYWLELKPLFEHYRVNYPMQVLRNSTVILPAVMQKKMEKLGLESSHMMLEVEQLINRYVRSKMNNHANLEEERNAIEKIFSSVMSKAEAADITLKNNAVAERQKALASLSNIEAKMLKAEKRKQETTVNQLRELHSAFFPEGQLQERKENFIPSFNAEFIPFLVSVLDPFTKSLKVIALGG